MLGSQPRPSVYFPFEPPPERSHVLAQGVNLCSLALLDNPCTLRDGFDALLAVPEGSVVLWDSLDAAGLSRDRITSGVQGLKTEFSTFHSLSYRLIQRGVSVLLISQMRMNQHGKILSSAYPIRSALTAAIHVVPISKTTKFGEPSWAKLGVSCTHHLFRQAGKRGEMWYHPVLGIAPEREWIEIISKKYSQSWRTKLGITLPRDYVAAVLKIRGDYKLYTQLKEVLWAV